MFASPVDKDIFKYQVPIPVLIFLWNISKHCWEFQDTIAICLQILEQMAIWPSDLWPPLGENTRNVKVLAHCTATPKGWDPTWGRFEWHQVACLQRHMPCNVSLIFQRWSLIFPLSCASGERLCLEKTLQDFEEWPHQGVRLKAVASIVAGHVEALGNKTLAVWLARGDALRQRWRKCVDGFWPNC